MNKLIYILPLFALFSCGSDYSEGTGKGGSMARFTIVADRLYTVSEFELSVFDISDKDQPELISKQYLNGTVETIFAKESYLFFGTRGGMLIYDNSDPDNPKFLSNYSHIYSCDPVVVHKGVAFVTLNSASSRCGRGENRLDIIDISDHNNPKLLVQHDMVSPKGLGIDGDVLFVCDEGLKAYHLDDFNTPTEIAQFDVDAYDVIPDNGYLLLIGDGGLHQYKYTDRTLRKVSTILIEQ